MAPEERNAWAAYDGHRIDRAELKAVLVAEAMAAMPYNRPCDCGSGLMVRICSLCLERARSAAVAEERETCARHLLAQYRNESWAAEAAAAIRARA